ncbi:MAG: hypothetical protein KJO43_02300, partial [Phycisphaerae bacterium]|nr:hypothetical protein [Phycisphaerae bacterium]
LDRRPRLLEEIVDMGAFEFQVAPPSPPAVTGDLVVAVRDDGALAFGLESPLLRYDADEDAWFEIVRNLPAYAIAADPERACFWVHSGENGMLGRVPYDTLELEEIGVLKFDGSPSFGLSGMAVRDGVVYGSVWRVGFSPDRLYTVNTETATLELVGEFPPDFEVWDLHYDASLDQMLVLSSPETIPPGPLGIFELDLDTFELTEVQRYVNDDPFSELNSLQGLAVGADRRFIFRSPYNKLEVFDATTGDLVTIAQVPDSVDRPGAGWLWGGLTWAPITLPADITGDGTVGFTDLLALLAAWGPCAGCPADLDGDGIVGFTDLLELLASWT